MKEEHLNMIVIGVFVGVFMFGFTMMSYDVVEHGISNQSMNNTGTNPLEFMGVFRGR